MPSDTDRPDAPPPSPAAARRAARMATPRMQRELHTIEVMLRLYCAAHHGGEAGLCEACGDLLDYAGKRLAGCPFGPDKPTCANCTIHCYGPAQREQIRRVMAWSGPRMALRHPILAAAHLIDGRRPAPPKPKGRPPAPPAKPTP